MADASRRPSVTSQAPVSPPVTHGLVPRVLQTWRAPRSVVRAQRDMPDTVLIVVLMIALLLFLLGQAPGQARAAAIDPTVPLAARMGGSVMAVMFLMPLVVYAVAEIVALFSRITPWQVASRHSRLALFWAMLAVTPAMLLSGLVAGLIGPGAALIVTQVIAGIGFFVFWGAGLAALAHR